MAGRSYCLLVTLAAVVAVTCPHDCGADVTGAPGHLLPADVTDDVTDDAAACRRQLTDDIEACLSAYERLLGSSGASVHLKPGQLRRPVDARRLCRSVPWENFNE